MPPFVVNAGGIINVYYELEGYIIEKKHRRMPKKFMIQL